MNKRSLIIAPAALAIGALLMFAFFGMRDDSPRHAAKARVRLVEATEVSLGPVSARIDAFGTLTSAQPLELYAEVAGELLPGEVPFQPAQSFARGALLLRIDDRQAQLERQAALSDLLTALANFLPEVKTEFPQDFELWQTYFNALDFDAPVPDMPEIGHQKIKLFLSRFNIYRLYFGVRNIEIKLEKYTIRAPFDGSVVATNLRAGSTVRGGSLLGRIINLEDLEVELPVAAADIPWIDLAAPVIFSSTEFGGEWQGNIKRVGAAIDSRTQTIPIYVGLEKDLTGPLWDGLFFEADLPGRSIADALEIPRRAIYDERFVYVVSDGYLDYREVTVARIQKKSVIISGGLQPGDMLVIEPLQGAAPGMPAKARLTGDTEGQP